MGELKWKDGGGEMTPRSLFPAGAEARRILTHRFIVVVAGHAPARPCILEFFFGTIFGALGLALAGSSLNLLLVQCLPRARQGKEDGDEWKDCGNNITTLHKMGPTSRRVGMEGSLAMACRRRRTRVALAPLEGI